MFFLLSEMFTMVPEGTRKRCKCSHVEHKKDDVYDQIIKGQTQAKRSHVAKFATSVLYKYTILALLFASVLLHGFQSLEKNSKKLNIL